MVGGIGGNSGGRFTPPPASNTKKAENTQPTAPNKGVEANTEVTAAQEQPVQPPVAQPTPQTEQALAGQMNAAAALGQSQIKRIDPAIAPYVGKLGVDRANDIQASMAAFEQALPPGGVKDQYLDNVAQKTANRLDPEFGNKSPEEQASKLSEIRMLLLEDFPNEMGLPGAKR